jgi:hypothetical protein
MPKKTSKTVYHQPKRRFFPGFDFFADFAFFGLAFLTAFLGGFLALAAAFFTGVFAAFGAGAGFVGARGSKTRPQSRQIIWSRIVLCTMFCEAQSGHSVMLSKWSSATIMRTLRQEV